MKKPIRGHRKSERHSLWQAARLEGKVKNTGIKPKKKAKKIAVRSTPTARKNK